MVKCVVYIFNQITFLPGQYGIGVCLVACLWLRVLTKCQLALQNIPPNNHLIAAEAIAVLQHIAAFAIRCLAARFLFESTDLYIDISLSLSLSRSLALSLYLSISLSLYLSISLSLSLYPSIPLSLYLSTFLHVLCFYYCNSRNLVFIQTFSYLGSL